MKSSPSTIDDIDTVCASSQPGISVGPVFKAPPGQMKKFMQILAGFGLTALCLYLAFRGLEVGEVLKTLGRARWSGLPVYLCLLWAFFRLKAVRWRLLLLPLGNFSRGEVTSPMMIGFMGNNVLPAHLGELMRALLVSRRFSVPRVAVLSTVVVERLLDTLVVILFLTIGGLLVDDLPAWLQYSARVLGAASIASVAAMIAFGARPHFFIELLRRLLGKAPARISEPLLGAVTSAAACLDLLRAPKVFAAILSISVLKWTLMAGMVFISLWSFRLEVPVWVSFLVVGVCSVGVMIPSAPGFFGVIQVCFWVTLQLFGVEKIDAVASSVYYHLGQYVPVTAAGLYYLNRHGLSLRRTSSDALEGP